jgi:hypothetical protein
MPAVAHRVQYTLRAITFSESSKGTLQCVPRVRSSPIKCPLSAACMPSPTKNPRSAAAP